MLEQIATVILTTLAVGVFLMVFAIVAVRLYDYFKYRVEDNDEE